MFHSPRPAIGVAPRLTAPIYHDAVVLIACHAAQFFDADLQQADCPADVTAGIIPAAPQPRVASFPALCPQGPQWYQGTEKAAD